MKRITHGQSERAQRGSPAAHAPGKPALDTGIHSSPRMVTQRQQLERVFGLPVQRENPEEEELQMKAASGVVQRQGPGNEDELLQGKFAPIQRQGDLEEEELLQGKFEPIQRQESDEEDETSEEESTEEDLEALVRLASELPSELPSVEDIEVPSENLEPVLFFLRGSRFGTDFEIKGTFHNPQLEQVRYKQLIRGTFKENGEPQLHRLPEGHLDPTAWKVDGSPDGGEMGAHDYPEGGKYVRQDEDGLVWKYTGSDMPSTEVKVGVTYEIDLEFMGQFWIGEELVESATWTVKGTHKAVGNEEELKKQVELSLEKRFGQQKEH